MGVCWVYLLVVGVHAGAWTLITVSSEWGAVADDIGIGIDASGGSTRRRIYLSVVTIGVVESLIWRLVVRLAWYD